MSSSFVVPPTNGCKIPPRLLRTNEAPTEFERAQIEECVKPIDNMLREARETIRVKEAELKILYEQERALAEVARPYHTALGGFRKLPVEVIQEIFLACVSGEEIPSVLPTEGPLLLMQISRDIRHIVLSTPSLWTAVHVDCTDIPYYEDDSEESYYFNNYNNFWAYESWFERRTPVIRQWLDRSGSMPLKIVINGGYMKGRHATSSDAMVRDLISVVVDFAHQWEDISITFPETSFPCLQKLQGSDVPLLHTLSLDICNTTIQFLDAPKLRNLSLSFLSSEEVTVWPTNLSRFEGIEKQDSHWDPTALNDLFKLSPQLVECNLVSWVGRRPATLTGLIDLPFLKVLTLGNCYYDHAAAFINAPLLERLENGYWDELEPLISVLDRSQNLSSLRTLMPLSDLAKILPHCPSLTTLHAKVIGETARTPCDAILDSMVLDGGLCPQLEHLSLDGVIFVQNVETLKTFCGKKYDPLAPARRPWTSLCMTVVVSGMKHGELVEHMREYCDGGVLQLLPPVLNLPRLLVD